MSSAVEMELIRTAAEQRMLSIRERIDLYLLSPICRHAAIDIKAEIAMEEICRMVNAAQQRVDEILNPQGAILKTPR